MRFSNYPKLLWFPVCYDTLLQDFFLGVLWQMQKSPVEAITVVRIGIKLNNSHKCYPRISQSILFWLAGSILKLLTTISDLFFKWLLRALHIMTLLHTQRFWKSIWISPFKEIHMLVHWLFRTPGVNSILYILIFSYLAISMLFHMVPEQSILTAEMLIFVMEKFLKISLDCWNAVFRIWKNA